MPSRTQLDTALTRYQDALRLRSHGSKSSIDLCELDKWYRGELRDAVTERRKRSTKPGPAEWLTKDELVRLMDWKLARGKWRPRLQQMVASNSEQAVRDAVSAAAGAADRETALKELSKLKAVGPATASAVLALWYPEDEPFMSDEGIDFADEREEGDNGKKLKRDYTVKAWREYRQEMQTRTTEEKWDSMEQLEKAIWAWATLRKYASEGDTGGNGDDTGTDAGERDDKNSGSTAKKREAASDEVAKTPSKKRRTR